jgi:hypothetical protein
MLSFSFVIEQKLNFHNNILQIYKNLPIQNNLEKKASAPQILNTLTLKNFTMPYLKNYKKKQKHLELLELNKLLRCK